MKKSFRMLFVTLLLMSPNFLLMAQDTGDYETIPSEQEGEVIYKGTCNFSDISTVPDFNWSETLAAYEPDAASIAILKEKLKGYQLLVFLGTWCEDSHRLVPQLYKVLQAAEYPLDQVRIEALDREKKGKENREQAYEVQFVPTILVFKDGVAIGRITEMVQDSVEQDLANMLR